MTPAAVNNLRRASIGEISAVAAGIGLGLSEADCRSYQSLMEDCLEACRTVEQLNVQPLAPRYPRSGARVPTPEENSLRAWAVRTQIRGSKEGKLAGRGIAIKDNIFVAGIPMENGSATLRGYEPEVDATVVTRALDAGAIIVGKTRCESFCASCASFTGAGGPVENPHRKGYSAGGSSSGSAAAVAAGEVDLAIGTDQGGSIRVPAALCGCVGLKPTYGLVPYSGIVPTELTLDHVGPLTATVADNALLLEVLAGPDGLDQRQHLPPQVSFDYTSALGQSVAGLRIGLLTEGFNLPGQDPVLAAKVRMAALELGRLGARVAPVSVPLHAMGIRIWLPIILEGSVDLMFTQGGMGMNWRGPFVGSYASQHAGWREQANDLPEVLKVLLVAGRWLTSTYQGRFYGKAQNAARALRAAYDAAFVDHDLLLMPTVLSSAAPHPGRNAGRELQFERAVAGTPNAAPFDVTGHPAISVPCGWLNGMPVGLMLVARHFAEHDIYRAASALERLVGAGR